MFTTAKFDQIFGYDKVILALDHAEVRGLRDAIQPHCRKFELIPELMPSNPVWKSKLEIYQPSNDLFPALLSCLGATCRAMPTYAELAWDVICPDAGQASALQDWRLAHLHLLNNRQSVVRYKTVWYYGRRSIPGQGKRGRVLAMYADKPCKLRGVKDGKACAHMELRLTGSVALQDIGVFSVADLAALDHIGLWWGVVNFLKVPEKKTELGRILHNQPGTAISGTALVNKANKFLGRYITEGRFVLENAIRDNKQLAQELKLIPFAEAIGDSAIRLI